jgi:hypothetical protein
MIEEPLSLKKVDSALKEITKKHKKVSDKVTPKAFIKKKMGMDYVEYSTMRDIADKEYPGWSWTIISSEALGSEAYVVHGRLKWYDCGVWREGDMVAAHRIQKKKGTTEFVDVGNDIKSANTDCIKKALNHYMNICDDVYRNQVEDPELDDSEIETLRKLAMKAEISEKVMNQIENGEVNKLNYKASKAKLERMTA